MFEKIDHINLVVSDLEGMVNFYSQVLGLKVTKRATIRGKWVDDVVGLAGVDAEVVYLNADRSPRIELIRFDQPAGATLEAPAAANTRGLRHLAFRVVDIDQAVAALEAAGVELVSGVQKVPDSQVTYDGGMRKRLVYFHDPEANLLELCEYR